MINFNIIKYKIFLNLKKLRILKIFDVSLFNFISSFIWEYYLIFWFTTNLKMHIKIVLDIKYKETLYNSYLNYVEF